MNIIKTTPTQVRMKSIGGTVYDSQGNDVRYLAPKDSVWNVVSVEWQNEDTAFLLEREGCVTWAHPDEISVL